MQLTNLLLLLVISLSHSQEDLDSLRQSIPGEPGLDYPLLASIPETAFQCQVSEQLPIATLANPAVFQSVSLSSLICLFLPNFVRLCTHNRLYNVPNPREKCLEGSTPTRRPPARCTTSVSRTTSRTSSPSPSSAPTGPSSTRRPSPASGGESVSTDGRN